MRKIKALMMFLSAIMAMLLIFGPVPAKSDQGDTTLVSKHSDGTQGNEYCEEFPFISLDGRYVAFTSQANNFVDNDTNEKSDIFVHDRQTGNTTLVSKH